MQSKTLTLLIFLFISNYLSAQSPSFDISAKVFYLPIQENTITTSFNYSRILPINDSTAIQSQYVSSRGLSKEYKPELGYELMSNINFPVNDKLSVRTGLGLNLNRFKVGTGNSFINQETLISTDTVLYASSSFSSTPYCSVYLNNSTEFDIESDIQYTLIHLRIPLEASIDLLDSKLRLNLGVYIQTPIVSQKHNEYLSLNRELVDGEYHCEYLRSEVTDKSGGNINNLLFGYSVSAEYFLSNNLALEIGALRDVGNTFYNAPDTNAFSNDIEDLTVTRYAIGLRYRIGKKVAIE